MIDFNIMKNISMKFLETLNKMRVRSTSNFFRYHCAIDANF